MLSTSAFGSADNTYLDLDHSGRHKTSSNNCLFIVFRNARCRLYLSDHKTQTCARFDPKCWYNLRKREKDNLPYVFSGVLCVFVTFSVKSIWWVIFVHFSYIITTFGMKRCKIMFFMRHFYQSLESSRELALRNTVNVWDHMSRVTSRCLEQFGCSVSCGSPTPLVKATLSIFILLYIQLFRERLSEKVHATIPKGIVGSLEFTVLQRNLREWHERPWTYGCECWRKVTKVGSTATVSGAVNWSYPILPFGIVACTFFTTTFLEIAVGWNVKGTV